MSRYDRMRVYNIFYFGCILMKIFSKIFFQMKRRSVFLLGLFVASFLGALGSYVKLHFSKEDDADSLLASTAHADVQPWLWGSGDGSGEGCGGCSADSSGG